MPEQVKSPDVQTLRTLVELIDEVINAGHEVLITDPENVQNPTQIAEPTLVAMRDALEWTYVFLLNRRDYHKKRNAKTKVLESLLKEKLEAAGINVAKIERDADRIADDKIIDNEDQP